MSRAARVARALSIVVLCATALAGPGPAAPRTRPQDPRKATAGRTSAALLEVRGEVPRPLTLSGEDFARLPRRSVRARGHDGVDSEYQGVPLVEVLSRSGAPTGAELRGPSLALYAVVEASDGYRALFALPELDPAFTDRVILLADRRDGRPLSDREGPLQVIVPGEKKHARWVRQVVRIAIGRG